MPKLLWIFCPFIVIIISEDFLNIPHDQLCASEPDLDTCRGAHTSQGNRGGGQNGPIPPDDPFSAIATRAPPRSHNFHSSFRDSSRPRPKSYREYLMQRNEYYRNLDFRQKAHSGYYNLYPGLYPKDQNYCETMKPNFAFTCQPGKSLRLDLVEFCKDYSVFCNIPNFHRIPGPREGPVPDGKNGRVGVNLGFGFSVGTVPGLEVEAGGGVDVGPFPGWNDNVGVGVGLNLGLLGSKSPEAYRRGMDNPNEKGGGIVGINGGVGVNAPGSGPIGVGSGVGVGK